MWSDDALAAVVHESAIARYRHDNRVPVRGNISGLAAHLSPTMLSFGMLSFDMLAEPPDSHATWCPPHL